VWIVSAGIIWFGLTESAVEVAKDKELIVVDATASGSVLQALEDLTSIGLQSEDAFGQVISGVLPRGSLAVAQSLESINQIRVSRTYTAAGSITSEGDAALRSDIARVDFGIDGTGVRVGVISDSYNCLGGEDADRLNDDLPTELVVVEEALFCEGMTDEGRALMHVVHDVAPGAQLLFFSGSNGYAHTANGILRLVNEYDVHIIVDDAKALAAPFFQKGVITQAAEHAVRRGVTYITAAGNSSRLSYESAYNETVNSNLNLSAHDFDPGPGTDIYQRFTLPEDASVSLLLQWDSPAFSVSGTVGANADLDIYVLDGDNARIMAESSYGNMGRDPNEFLEFHNPVGSGQTEFDLLITKVSGRAPSLLKYIVLNRFDGEFTEYRNDSSTIFGHANSEYLLTVGAGSAYETPAFGASEPLLEFFSSAGGTPWLFDNDGRRLSEKIVPDKPNVIAPDNVNTPFFDGEDTDGDGYPNFRGTSAAAPHAAGVVALMLEINPELHPRDVMSILELTAIDVNRVNDEHQSMLDEDFDFRSGFGLIDALAAVSLASSYTPGKLEAATEGELQSVLVHTPASTGAGAALACALILLLIGMTRSCFYRA